jgi:hypothetical protein
MGFFSRKPASGAAVIIAPDMLNRLPDIGRAVFLDAEIGVDVSGFYLPGFLAAGAPSPGTPGWDAFTDQFLGELLGAAGPVGGWTIAGAFYVAKDFVASEDHVKPRFVEIVDQALVFMAGAGVSPALIPMFALDRWDAIQRPGN